MNIREIKTPITAATLNESLAKRYGTKIDVAKFTLPQLEDARNKIRTMLKDIETNESFDSVKSESYQKSKLFLDVLNQAIKEAPAIVETDEAEADVNIGPLESVREYTAEMQTESMLELADAIRDELGSEKSEAFTNAVKPSLEAMYTAMESTREALTTGVGIVTGEGEAVDTMGAEDPADEMEPTVDADEPAMDPETGEAEDDFGADAAAAGGEEEAGRETRESIERSRKIGSLLAGKKS